MNTVLWVVNPPELLHALGQYLPQASVSYCLALWRESPFFLRILHPRSTKLGDFRYDKGRKTQTITINQDLNPYQFLLTYIHEVAHLRVFEKLGPRHKPHGPEWKEMFRQLMEPILNAQVFTPDLLVPLRRHMLNPAASSTRDLFLMKEMSKYDSKNTSGEKFLSDLAPGAVFFLSGRKFRKGETRRTRVLCEEIPSGRKFLVSQLAKVRIGA